MNLRIHAYARGLVAAACCLLSLTVQAQFNPGTVVVYQVGDGLTYGTGVGAPVILKAFLPNVANQSTANATVNVPSTGAGRLVNAISANSEGFMTLSTDSTKLVLAGYDTSAGFAAVTASTSLNVARAVDTVNVMGVVGRAVATNSAFSAATFRAATKGSGENYWATGSNSGVYYMGTSSMPIAVNTSITNLRVIAAQNGNLYISTASSSGTGLYKISGQPTTTATSTLLISMITGASPYGFSINSGETVAYIADDRTTSTSPGGIYRWTLSGTTWSATDTLKPGSQIGARGVTVDWSGSYPIVYATTTDNKLVRWVDSGNASHIYTVLATAPANTFFRSVALSPKSAVTCTPPSAAVTPADTASFCQGGKIVLHTNSAAGLTYIWKKNGVALAGAADSTLSVTTGGLYKVIVTNSGGCSDSSANDTVVVNPLPVNLLTLIPRDTLCAGDTIRLRATGGNGNRYQWIGLGPVAAPVTDSNIVAYTLATISTPQTYQVYAIITSAAGCVDTTATPARFAVYPLPNPAIVNNSGTLSTGAYAGYQWYLNGTAIPGATGAAYTPATNGNYSLRATGAGSCAGISAVVNVANVGIKSTLSAAGIRLYPNPVANRLYVDAPFEVSLTVSDVQGRILRKAASAKSISLEGLSAGAYTISVRSATGLLLGTQVVIKRPD